MSGRQKKATIADLWGRSSDLEWLWSLKPLGPKEFLIEFPDITSIDGLTKFVNGVYLISNDPVQD
jgi:hypothetical protein